MTVGAGTATPKADWAKSVRECLNAQGRSQRWLSKRTGMDYDTLRQMTSGNPKYKVTVEQLGGMAEALAIPIGWLVENQKEGEAA